PHYHLVTATTLLPFLSLSHLPYLHSFPTRRSSDLRLTELSLTSFSAFLCLSALLLSFCLIFDSHSAPSLSSLSCLSLSACNSISDRKSTRLNSSHVSISYAVFCLKKKTDKLLNTQS